MMMINIKKVVMMFIRLGKFCFKKVFFRINMLFFFDEKSCNKEMNVFLNLGFVEYIDR